MTRSICFALCLAWAGDATALSDATPESRQVQATRCEVTVARVRTRPPESVPPSFNYGNARIAVALVPPNGKLVAGRLASGGKRATINADGSLRAKFGWWRAGRTKPIITGRRLDAHAAPMKARVPDGYGNGFQATVLTFPTTGCWRITGSFHQTQLTFTMLVTKSRLGP